MSSMQERYQAEGPGNSCVSPMTRDVAFSPPVERITDTYSLTLFSRFGVSISIPHLLNGREIPAFRIIVCCIQGIPLIFCSERANFISKLIRRVQVAVPSTNRPRMGWQILSLPSLTRFESSWLYHCFAPRVPVFMSVVKAEDDITESKPDSSSSWHI